MCPLCMWHTRAAQACVSWSLPANFIEVMQRERCCAQLQPCPGDEVRLCCAQDAIVLARTLRDALGGSGSPSLKQQTLVKVDEALRNFERERTRRKLKISVKSNLMGAALQIPFAPVNNLGAPIMCSSMLFLVMQGDQQLLCGDIAAQLLVCITPMTHQIVLHWLNII